MMRRFGLGGTGTTNSGAPAIQFEDFQPISEWKEGEIVPPSHSQPQKASLLHIHLPEFKKEQLKVTFVQATRALRVSGERPLSDNRRSRFNVAFAVPNNCDATQIQGKFHDGVLLLTMPQFPSTSTTPPAAAAAAGPPPVAPQPVVKEAPPHPLAPPPPATAVNQQEAPQSKAAAAPEVKDTPNKNDQSKSEHGKDIPKGHDAKIVPPATESKPPPPPLDKEKLGKVPDDNNNNPNTPEADRKQAAGTTSSKKRKQNSSVAAAAAATEEINDEFDGEGVTSSGIKKRKEELTAAGKDAAESTSRKLGEIGERVKESAAAVVKSTAETAGKGRIGMKERMDELMREENRQAVVGMSLAVIAAVAVGAFVIYRYRSSSS